MDDSNGSAGSQPAENTDLAKQYQEILNQYSQELAAKPTPDTSIPEPEIPATIPITEVPLPPPPVIPQPQPPTPPSPPAASPKTTPSSGPIVSKPKGNNFFKFLFFISLIIFLGVCGAILYTVISPNQNGTPTPTPTPAALPTVISKVCQLNDKNYLVGSSFPAADGCNTCSCTADLTIVCTEKACAATPTATVSAIPKTWKTYNNTKYKYQVRYPTEITVTSSDVKESLSQTSSVNFRLTADQTPAESGFNILVLPNPDSLSLSDWIAKNPNSGLLLPASGQINSSNLIIDDQTWKKIAGNSIGYTPTGNVVYSITHNGNLYYVVLYSYDAKNLDQILSTFKFTPSTTPTIIP